MQNVSFPQIVNQLYKVFSNEAEASQYTNTQSGAQYMGLCGWAGTMSPLNRAAFLKEFGQDVTDRAEREARARVAEYRAAYEASEYHRHELEAGEADPDQVPAVGSFVFGWTDWLKCEGGPMDPLKNHVNDWGSLRPELVEIAAVVEVEPAEFLSAETAHSIAREHQNHGGSRYNEADPLRLDGQPYAWTTGVLVVCRAYGDGEKSQTPARWYIVDSEGFSWARYILMPQRFASMYAEEIADLRAQRAAVEAQKAAEEEAAKAARLAEYRARCARWEGAGLVDVRPMIEAEKEANKAHGWRSAEAKSAARKLAAARRRNILTMCQAAAPGVKFSVKKWDGWGGSYEVSWTDGPTADSLKAAADLDLLEEGRDTFDGMTDCAGHTRAEFVDFAAQYLGVFGEINTSRETSPEYRAEIIARIREAVPGLPEDDAARIYDEDQQAAICALHSDRPACYIVEHLEREGLRGAAWYIAHNTSRPTTSEAPTDPTPDNGGTGAAYGDSEKSQNQEAPDGLTLEEIPGGVAVVGDSRATYKARRDIKAHGARWNKAAQRWEATDPEAVESLRQWLTPAPVADATPTEEAAPVAYGEGEKSQPQSDAERLNGADPEAEAAQLPAPPAAVVYDPAQPVERAEFHTVEEVPAVAASVPMDADNPETSAPTGAAYGEAEKSQLQSEGERYTVTINGQPYGECEKSQLQEMKEKAMRHALAESYEMLKAKHPDAVIFYRTGDFYTLYRDDAKKAAEITGLIVKPSKACAVSVSFPYHALDTYLPKFVRAGVRCCICDAPEVAAIVKTGSTPTDAPTEGQQPQETQQTPTAAPEAATGAAYGNSQKSQIPDRMAEAINSELVVVDGAVMKHLKFSADDGTTYTNIGTAALLLPRAGFLVMPDGEGIPYSAAGGYKALREILQAGGFSTFEGFRFVWPLHHDAQTIARLRAAYGDWQKSLPGPEVHIEWPLHTTDDAPYGYWQKSQLCTVSLQVEDGPDGVAEFTGPTAEEAVRDMWHDDEDQDRDGLIFTIGDQRYTYQSVAMHYCLDHGRITFDEMLEMCKAE